MRTEGVERERSERDPRAALLHPAFLLALALLLLNDHLLKGAHVLPGAITGKLSDVAGLVVAPIALAALVRARSRRAQLALHVLVGVSFALTELSQSSADALAHGLRMIGVTRATLVSDPSDLWALTVLPLPYALLGAERAPVSRGAPRVSLALALFACIASGQPPAPPPQWTTTAYLVNGMSTAADVRVAWTAASLDCRALSALPPGLTLSRVVDPAIFGDAVTFHLEPGATVPIDETNARAAVGPARFGSRDTGLRDAATPRTTSGNCQLVLLRAERATDRIVVVSSVAPFAVATNLSQPTSPERAVQLREAGGSASWVVGSGLPNDDATVANAPTTCTTARASMAFSNPLLLSGTLSGIDVGADGCVDLRLAQELAAPVHLFLCGIPIEMIPFTVGDRLFGMSTGSARLSVRRPGEAEGLIVLGPVREPVSVGPNTVTPGAPEPCNGERVACGAFVIPLAFGLTPTAPGDDPRGIVTHVDGLGRTRLLVGTSERVLVAMPGCTAGRDSPGIHAQLAFAHTAL